MPLHCTPAHAAALGCVLNVRAHSSCGRCAAALLGMDVLCPWFGVLYSLLHALCVCVCQQRFCRVCSRGVQAGRSVLCGPKEFERLALIWLLRLTCLPMVLGSLRPYARKMKVLLCWPFVLRLCRRLSSSHLC